MGLYINSQKFKKPYLNGVRCNAYVNGNKVWRSADKYVAFNGESSNEAIYSADGITWQKATLPVKAKWGCTCYGNGKYIALNNDGSKLALYSEDGVDWNAVNLPNTYSFEHACYGNGKYMAVCHKGYYGLYSEDGIDWKLKDITSILLQNSDWGGMCYNKSINEFYAFGHDSQNYTAMFCDDWNTWYTYPSPNCSGGACYGNGKMVVLGFEGVMAYSTTKNNWQTAALPVAALWGSVCYGNGKYVAVRSDMSSNQAIYSSDGISWQLTTLPVTTVWKSVCYGNGKYVAVGNNSAAFSTDGINWYSANLPQNLSSTITTNWSSVTSAE